MEYCNLGTIKDYIAKKPAKRLPEAAARCFVRQILSGLLYLNSNGLVHRDLKSENILLTGEAAGIMLPTVKIADFGIAAIVDNTETNMQERIGTLQYMAPEIIRNGQYNSQCDLWSCGVIFFEMLTGYTPFANARTLEELYKRLLSDEIIDLPTTPESTSDSARMLLRSLLQRDPLRRITFTQITSDPYLDLPHPPSNDQYNIAIGIIDKAISLDEQLPDNPTRNELQRIIDLYADGLAHLMSYSASLNDPGGAVAVRIRQQVGQILKQAEKVKEELASLEAQINKPTENGVESGWNSITSFLWPTVRPDVPTTISPDTAKTATKSAETSVATTPQSASKSTAATQTSRQVGLINFSYSPSILDKKI
ncbi:hypothetical protein HDU76_000789 [Blyttiomyces sp. JEL0837]|nr:hypothetical protein HDU76_000789 [Blyttiomyces sp. JEL0837]